LTLFLPLFIGVFGLVKLIQYGCIKTACGNIRDEGEKHGADAEDMDKL
jgi:hypothetical protein